MWFFVGEEDMRGTLDAYANWVKEFKLDDKSPIKVREEKTNPPSGPPACRDHGSLHFYSSSKRVDALPTPPLAKWAKRSQPTIRVASPAPGSTSSRTEFLASYPIPSAASLFARH
mmetsp:Transcript_63398/g.143000  ORF Transcript_63398/g.143000 Transcript_63398/m.143000 type:complete len:115 (+) Transcript_63398:673-1017(+)